MDVIIKKTSKGKDIDIISENLENIYYKFLRKGFVKVPYYFGFFMKKLSTKGLITFHIQNEVIFLYKETLIIIEGFSKLILENNYNYDYMIFMMKIYFEKNSKDYYIKEIEKFYKKSMKEINIEKEIRDFIKNNNLRIVKKNIALKKILLKLRRLKYFFYPRFIAITGIDGSGKSSTISELKKIMGNNSRVIYMGKKDWILNISKFAFEKKRFPSIINLVILYIEYWTRYLKSFRNTKVVIFDRYPTELYLSQSGVRKLAYYILFNLLYPKPNYIFYLHCPVETSLERKNDIKNKENFKKLKLRYDNLYKNYVSFDTSKMTQREVIKKIIKSLSKKTVEIL